jgi:hypothetical protein
MEGNLLAASGVSLRPARVARRAIQSGSSGGLSGQYTTTVPTAASALTQAVSCPLLQVGLVTSSTVSGGGESSNAVIAAAPSTPGRPVGSRRSITRREANSERLAPARANSFQSKLGSA